MSHVIWNARRPRQSFSKHASMIRRPASFGAAIARADPVWMDFWTTTPISSVVSWICTRLASMSTGWNGPFHCKKNRTNSSEIAKDGGYFDAGSSDPSLLSRTRESYDGAEPSPNSTAAMNLLRLAQFTDRAEWRDKANKTLSAFTARLQSSPDAVPALASALDFRLWLKRNKSSSQVILHLRTRVNCCGRSIPGSSQTRFFFSPTMPDSKAWRNGYLSWPVLTALEDTRPHISVKTTYANGPPRTPE